MAEIRVVLPYHLRTLAKVDGDVLVAAGDTPTIRTVLDAIEDRHPVLKGTLRDHSGVRRRPFIRFFALKEDLSHDSWDVPLPAAVIDGSEPLYIVGAMAGG